MIHLIHHLNFEIYRFIRRVRTENKVSESTAGQCTIAIYIERKQILDHQLGYPEFSRRKIIFLCSCLFNMSFIMDKIGTQIIF